MSSLSIVNSSTTSIVRSDMGLTRPNLVPILEAHTLPENGYALQVLNASYLRCAVLTEFPQAASKEPLLTVNRGRNSGFATTSTSR
jgi:hypothetical protein